MMTCGYQHAFERSAAPPDEQPLISFRDINQREP